MYSIGKIFENNKGDKFEIIEKLDGRKRRIKFLNTGYERITTTSAINLKSVRNKARPTICGIGISDLSSTHLLYDRWRNMLRRCYDENHYNYPDYGAKGITVCKKWHTFSNYVKDIEQKENYDKLVQDSKNWQVDKDILIPNNKIYSNETTLIVHISENSKQAQLHSKRNTCVSQYTKQEELIMSYKSIAEASRQTGVNPHTISHCCNGRQKTAGGYIWKYKK